MPIEISNPSIMPGPVGQYSHLSVVPTAGRMAFISGQVPVDDSGEVVGRDDFEAQTEQVFRNLELALKALGCNWANLAKMTTFITSADFLDDFRAMRARLFPEYFPDSVYPANTLLVVSGLVRPEFLVEIEGIAVLES